MKHMSQSVQASTTVFRPALSTAANSPLEVASIRSNRRGKLSQRLKQRRQPWQMSNTQRNSVSSFSASKKSGFRHGIGCRVGASRPPSRMTTPLASKWRRETPCKVPRPLFRAIERLLLAQGDEGFLEPAGVGLFGLGQGFEPVGDFVETFLAGRFRHAGVHVRVFVGLAGNGGL